jgi:hypothetical protein
MSDEKASKDKALIKIHIIGGMICLGIIAGAVWFASDSIAKRRGLFLSARHELSDVRSDLDKAVTSRTSLATRVQQLEEATRDSLELMPVQRLNKRTEELSRLCESVRVAVDTLQPGEMIVDSRVPVQPLELSGSAAASDVNLLLERFDQQLPDMHIQSIDMMSESLGSSRVRLRMSLYWFVDPTSGS